MTWIRSPARASFATALIVLVATAMIFVQVSQPVQAEFGSSTCSAPFLIDGFRHGNITNQGTRNDEGSWHSYAYSYGTTQPFPVTNGHVLVPQGLSEFGEKLNCFNPGPFSGISFSLEYSPAIDDPIWPTVWVSAYQYVEQCLNSASASTLPNHATIGDLGRYRQPDGTFVLPSSLWSRFGTVLLDIKFLSFDQRTGLKRNDLDFVHQHDHQYRLDLGDHLHHFEDRARRPRNDPDQHSPPAYITPRPAHTNVLPSVRPVLPARPSVSASRPVTVTLPVPRATPGFTFNLTTKTFGTAASPLVVVDYVPVAFPRVTVPPVARPPAKKLVQNDAAALDQAVRTDDEEGDRAHDNVAAPLV
ncbi:hypothetical protein GGF32_006948 [Allomyces javanicus]|nr:hypothetical protein GGF32_006948 [Allomyces javanicus]